MGPNSVALISRSPKRPPAFQSATTKELHEQMAASPMKAKLQPHYTSHLTGELILPGDAWGMG